MVQINIAIICDFLMGVIVFVMFGKIVSSFYFGAAGADDSSIINNLVVQVHV